MVYSKKIYKFFQFFFVITFVVFFSQKSIAKILEVGNGKNYSTIQSAVNDAFPGDTVLVYAGTYPEEVKFNIRDGQQGNPITMKAAEAGVIIDGQGKRNCMFVTKKYITIDGNGYGIELANGYYYYDGSPFNKRGGLWTYHSDYLTVKNIKISSTTGAQGNYGSGEQNWQVMDLALNWSNFVTIENCKLTSTGVDANLMAGGADNLIIRNCVIGGAINYPAKFLGTNDALIEKNYIYSTSTRVDKNTWTLLFRDSDNGVIRYNIVDGRDSEAIGVLDLYDDANLTPNENHKIYNNMFLADSGQTSAVRLYQDLEGVEFRNNIMVHPSYGVELNGSRASSGIVLDHNIIFAPTQIRNLNSSSYTSTNNINMDPKIEEFGMKPIPFYRLKTSSPAINAGFNITNYNGTDFMGNKVPNENVTDIGSFEAYTTNSADQIPPKPPLLLAIE